MKYGCNTSDPDFKPRKDTYKAQDGWTDETRFAPRMITVPDVMSKTCQYDRAWIDEKCEGCKERK